MAKLADALDLGFDEKLIFQSLAPQNLQDKPRSKRECVKQHIASRLLYFRQERRDDDPVYRREAPRALEIALSRLKIDPETERILKCRLSNNREAAVQLSASTKKAAS
ncbi:hypothetical protein [Paracoccus sp. (in: a-proteobacteria)]|uniref:hypothetical protein n=1 Tax=Paracoccus sp. TaxID=267 RepID=UPI00396CBD80